MTPEQLKQNPIMVHPNQKLDTDDEESTKDEEELTTSQELTEECSTSGIHSETTEESKPTETSLVLTVFNKTIHHEDDSSEDQSDTIADDTEGSKSTEDEEESEAIEIQQVHNVLNKTTHDEKDTCDQKSVTEIETYTKDGEKNNAKQDKLLTTNFQVEMENQKLKCS